MCFEINVDKTKTLCIFHAQYERNKAVNGPVPVSPVQCTDENEKNNRQISEKSDMFFTKIGVSSSNQLYFHYNVRTRIQYWPFTATKERGFYIFE